MTHALLWMDFESTNTLENDPVLLEAAFILTDTNLTELATETFVLPYRDEPMPQIVHDMHVASGLLDDARAVSANREDLMVRIGVALHEMCVLHGITTVTIAGSGVAHFDAPFFHQLWPKLAQRLNITYYVYDVGSLRRGYRWATGNDLTDVNSSKTHRAFDDISCHLNEAREFAWFFRGE